MLKVCKRQQREQVLWPTLVMYSLLFQMITSKLFITVCNGTALCEINILPQPRVPLRKIMSIQTAPGHIRPSLWKLWRVFWGGLATSEKSGKACPCSRAFFGGSRDCARAGPSRVIYRGSGHMRAPHILR